MATFPKAKEAFVSFSRSASISTTSCVLRLRRTRRYDDGEASFFVYA